MSMRLNIRNNRGFTLIELLVVMAIAAILIGLVMGPVTQSFNMTRRAQAMVESQDIARFAMEQISRELGQAMYVYDNAQDPVVLPVRQPGNRTALFELPYAKIDIVLPKITMHCNNPNHRDGDPRDYPRGDDAWPPCPYCTDNGIDGADDVEARPKLPMEQDGTIVRYFLGLRYNDPAHVRNGGWKSPWGEGYSDPNTENQVVLYRVEFSPTEDADLFEPGASFEEMLADTDSFYHPDRWEKWKMRARVVGTPKYQDLVVGTVDPNTGEVTKVEPTVTFRTDSIENDTFKGAYSGDKFSGYPNSVPTVFHAKHPYWVPPYNVVVYRNNYETAYTTAFDGGQFIVKKFVNNGGNWQDEGTTFIIDAYRDPRGRLLGEITDGGGPENVEMAFTIDPNRGSVDFALDAPGEDNRASGPAFVMTEQDIKDLNAAFRDVYHQDPGSARRRVLLSTFDSGKSSQYMPNARMVPGSERVMGPNMTPGSGYGRQVRYERVPLALGDPGLNQYKINYDTGDLFFSQRWDQNLPEDYGNIEVDYKVRFIRDGDVVKGDYSTKSLLNIRLGIRVFDPNSGKPHITELTNSVKIRNALR